jgi:phage gp16-like protein
MSVVHMQKSKRAGVSAIVATTDPRLKSMRSSIMAACAKSGMDEETRRNMFEKVTGKRSLTAMRFGELGKVLDEINSNKNPVSHGAKVVQNKVTALWKSAWALGVIEQDNTAALDAFIKRQTGCAKFIWLKPGDANKVVEALKVMLSRAGVRWVQDGSPGVPPVTIDPATAVWRALTQMTDREGVTEHMYLTQRALDYIRKVSGHTGENPERADIQAAIMALGRKRRKFLEARGNNAS